MTDSIYPLNIFYQEPDPDRWFRFDRFPRKLIRRLIRGKQRPGGVMMVALELMRGLDKLNISYRFNDFRYIKKHPEELACIIGKPQVLFNREWENPIIFGAGIYSHPVECVDLFKKYPNVKKILVPGEWMKNMFAPYYGDKVLVWPVGIDTEKWRPTCTKKKIDLLIYNKTHGRHENTLVNPILNFLKKQNITYHIIKYGTYTHNDLIRGLDLCKAAIFLSPSETQGLAYQQILATDTPVFAWDRGGYWEDPEYFPHKVKYQPVSSVPYWSKACGEKFKNIDDFESNLLIFLQRVQTEYYSPRSYIIDNLTLEKSALAYLDIIKFVNEDITNS